MLPEQARNLLFHQNKDRLEHMAFRATKKGMAREEFLTIAIDVDDPYWSDLVENLMPGQDFQAIRDRGEKPVARGTVYTDVIIDYLCEVCPDIAPALRSEPPQGFVRAVVLSKGVSVYHIEPYPHFKDS
jgi:hypothetical protein